MDPSGRKNDADNANDSAGAASKASSAFETPQELYNQIKKSRDKLFFVAYSDSNDPKIDVSNGKTKKGNDNDNKYQWHLVRVDLSTCQDLENTKNCQETGNYYVEFYTKASYDRGFILPGNRLENGIPAVKMKVKPDSESRYWLQWHAYVFDKSGDMIVGKAREFHPNSKEAILRRLMDLSQRRRSGGASSSAAGENNNNEEEGQERLMSEYHPNFNKFTPWADEMNLMDTKTRLVGPFDFEDVKPPPLNEEDLVTLSKDMKQLFTSNHSKLHVKDHVHLSRWQELLEASKRRNIVPPTIAVEKVRKKKRSGRKRDREEGNGKAEKLSGEKRVKEELKAEVIGVVKGPVCQLCGKGATAEEPLLLFPATSSQSSFYVHSSCGAKNSDDAIVPKATMKDEVISIVEAAFTETRQSTSKDGHSYCVLGELKEALNQSLASWMSGEEARVSLLSRERATASSVTAGPPEPLVGLPEAGFSQEEVESFPIAFAVHKEDTGETSEQNARIAKLDYEVEQRRLKRKSIAGTKQTNKSKSSDTGAASKPKSTSPKKQSKSPRIIKNYPTVSEKDLLISAEPAEGFPDGWLTRKVPRAHKSANATGGDKRDDTYWFSPKKQFKFRSKPQVRRFLDAMKNSGGDESRAIEKVKKY